MKKVLLFIVVFSLLHTSASALAAPAPEDSAGAMILLHPASGRVLAEKNADARMLIASTTKLMTALVAAEEGDLQASVTAEYEWTAVEGSSMYLRPGETYTLLELLEGLLLASGNDAAMAVSCAVAGDVDSFVERLNRRAASLSLTGTHFENPHGLDGEGHYSTARDLAVIMSAALENETLRRILGMRTCTVHGLTYSNHNKLLWSCRGVNGGKTGYTEAAGRCLVTSCRRDGLELVCVTLSDPNDWQDHARLYDWAFGEYHAFTLERGQPIVSVPVISGVCGELAVSAPRELCLCLEKDSAVTLSCALPPFAFAPVEEGESAGVLRVLSDGQLVCQAELVWNGSSFPRRRSGAVMRDVLDRLIGVYRV